MSDELKPCPFCGGEAKYWEYENEHDIFDPDSLGYVDTRYFIEHCVGCDTCKIVLARPSKEEAVAAWNARAERTCRRVVEVPAERGCGQPALRAVCSECGDKLGVTAAFCKRCGAKVVE